MKGIWIASVYAAVALFFSGCGGGADDQVDVYPVSGTVTFSGGPLANASVVFAPKEGQPAAMGRTDNQGHYALTTYDPQDGAAKGAYAVVITKVNTKEPSGSVDAQGHSSGTAAHSASAANADDSGNLVPDQYGSSDTTPLTETVKPDTENEFDFEIQ